MVGCLQSLARHLNQLGAQRTVGPRYRKPEPDQPEPETPTRTRWDMNPALGQLFRHPLWGQIPE